MVRNLSIIIPFYEKQEALQKTLETLVLQIHPEDRIYIIDDHSPNGVPDFNCSCTKVIRPPKRVPHIYRLNTLRNLGIESASNDACIIIDPDCIPNYTFLKHARRVYDPSVLFAGAITYLDMGGRVFKKDPRNADAGSRWVDRSNMSCGMVWGGCMYFSKRRASLVGLFDTDFDGGWGSEEHVFASACRNSGMRLRYDKGLMVFHQWHEKQRPGEVARNRQLFHKKIANHREVLNFVTPYNPAVAVLMVSTKRPYYIDQGMRAIFRHMFPLKVRLINNGDNSSTQNEEMSWWSDRWAVEYIKYGSQRLLSTIRTNAIKDYLEKKYRYLILLDDDITPIPGALTTLISEMENNPQYHAMAGYIIDKGKRKRFIGGKIKNSLHYYYHPVKPETVRADYISSGFTIIRLNTFVPYSEDWEMGWNDWDWSNEVTKRGLKVAVTGKAGAYHRYLFTSNGMEYKKDPKEYTYLRYDKPRHDRMAKRFKNKWGYTPKADRPITEMK